MKKFLEVVVTVVVAFAVALALKTYVFTNVEVWGSSMDDTLYGGVSTVEDGKVVYHGGDKLLVLKLGKVKKGILSSLIRGLIPPTRALRKTTTW